MTLLYPLYIYKWAMACTRPVSDTESLSVHLPAWMLEPGPPNHLVYDERETNLMSSSSAMTYKYIVYKWDPNGLQHGISMVSEFGIN